MGLGLAIFLQLAVVSSGDCPRADEVLARWRALLEAHPSESEHRAVLERVGANLLRIRLLGSDGHALASRDLPMSGTCEQLAAAVAVVLTVWETRLDSGEDLEDESATPAASDSPAARAPPASTPPEKKPALRPGPSVDNSVRSSHFGPRELELGVMAGGPGPLVIPELGLSFGTSTSPAALGLRVWLAEPKARALGAGSVSFQRWGLSSGLRASFWMGRLQYGWWAEALIDSLYVSGRGFATNYSSRAWEFGFHAGLRVAFRAPFQTILPWLGFSAWTWPRTERVLARNYASDVLPDLALVASGGMLWDLPP